MSDLSSSRALDAVLAVPGEAGQHRDEPGMAVPLVRGLQALAVVVYAAGVWASSVRDEVDLTWIRPLDGLLSSGNAAVAILLSCAGFLTCHLLLDARERGMREMVEECARHVWRLWFVTAVVTAAVMVIQRLDETRPPWPDQRYSVTHLLSFRWNTFLVDHAFEVPRELQSLWYFSAQVQLVLVLAAVVLLVRNSPRLVAVLALLASVSVPWWKVQVVDDLGWFVAAWSTVFRADCFAIGVLAAAASRLVRLSTVTGSVLAGGSLLGLLGVLLMGRFLEADEVMYLQLPVLAVLAGLVLAGGRPGLDRRSSTVVLLTSIELRTVGHLWPWVFAWSSVSVLFVARHLGQSPWGVRMLVTFLAIGVLAVASEALLRTVEWRFGEWRRGRERVDGDSPVDDVPADSPQPVGGEQVPEDQRG